MFCAVQRCSIAVSHLCQEHRGRSFVLQARLHIPADWAAAVLRRGQPFSSASPPASRARFSVSWGNPPPYTCRLGLRSGDLNTFVAGSLSLPPWTRYLVDRGRGISLSAAERLAFQGFYCQLSLRPPFCELATWILEALQPSILIQDGRPTGQIFQTGCTGGRGSRPFFLYPI